MIYKEVICNTVQEPSYMPNVFLALKTQTETEKCLLCEILCYFTIVALPKIITKDGSLVEIIGVGEIVRHHH
ncbi:MAG TPA: hypothetical protein VJB60_02920 [Candidatus Peribacterales bacterium]|nr:hypothetical protein [Candidatus Peribacterales bacterium]